VAPFVLDDLGVVARRVIVWETDESCAVASLIGEPVDLGRTILSAVRVDHR